MSEQGMTISQAAKTLGVSTRTIRRYIKAGKISATLIAGPFGEEYRIFELPPELISQTSSEVTGKDPGQMLDIVREMHEKNLALAAQLGAATERIRNLENQVKLLTSGQKKPWWQRLIRRK
jgi:excisionase family DNA binding protein